MYVRQESYGCLETWLGPDLGKIHGLIAARKEVAISTQLMGNYARYASSNTAPHSAQLQGAQVESGQEGRSIVPKVPKALG